MELNKANQRELAKLIVSIRASAYRLDLLMAICDDPDVRETVINRYETVMKQEGVTTYRASLDPNAPSLKASLTALAKYNTPLQSGENVVVTVLGATGLFGVRLNEEKSEQEKFFFSLQWTRESLREFKFPVVLWLSGAIAKGVAQKAQDFWSWRGGVFEFEGQQRQAIMIAPEIGEIETRSLPINENPELAQKVAELEQQIIDLRQQNTQSPLLRGLYTELGDTYQQQGNKESALDAYRQALDSAKEPEKQAEIFIKLGKTLQRSRRFESAQEYFQQALEIFEKLDHKEGQLQSYYQLGRTARYFREFELSKEYFQKNLELKERIKDRQGQASTYHMLGIVTQELREFELARSYYQQALDIYVEFNDRYSQASTYSQLGLLAEELKDFQQAKTCHLQDLQLSVEFNDQRRIDFATSNLARIYKTTHDQDLVQQVATLMNKPIDEIQQRFDAPSNSSDNSSSPSPKKRLIALFLILLVLDATLIYLSKDLWAIGRILFTAATMYFTLEGYRWAKWLLIAVLSLSAVALIGLVAVLSASLSTVLSVGSIAMAILCGIIIYTLQTDPLTQFFAQRRKARQQSDAK